MIAQASGSVKGDGASKFGTGKSVVIISDS